MSTELLAQLPVGIQLRIDVLSIGCWQWTGSVSNTGYGLYSMPGGKTWLVHRLVPELLGFPLGEHMHHECELKLCVNPLHLHPVTALEHAREHRESKFKELCKHGHPLDEAYLVRRSDGTTFRMCSHCARERSKRAYHADPEANTKRTERRRRQRQRERAES
jgi:hypothetical protein